MNQTDSQTDRAFHFMGTAYGEDMLKLEDVSGLPQFVKKVYGGREICPKTGREHFQYHIACRTQQRWSAIKKWLTGAHIQVARVPKDSIAYAMKVATASGVKQVIEPDYIDNQKALMMLAEICPQFCKCIHPGKTRDEYSHLDENENYWHRVRKILWNQPHLCGLYGKPDLFRIWKNTEVVWHYHHQKKEAEQIVEALAEASGGEGGIVLPPLPEGDFPEGENIIISDNNTDATLPPPSLQYQEEEDGLRQEEGRSDQS